MFNFVTPTRSLMASIVVFALSLVISFPYWPWQNQENWIFFVVALCMVCCIPAIRRVAENRTDDIARSLPLANMSIATIAIFLAIMGATFLITSIVGNGGNLGVFLGTTIGLVLSWTLTAETLKELRRQPTDIGILAIGAYMATAITVILSILLPG